MTITRKHRNLGPGHLVTAAGTIYCTSIRLAAETTWLDHTPAGFGRIGRNKVSELVRIACTPVGTFSPAIAAYLWPYGAAPVGTSLFGDDDTPATIHTLSGQKWTFRATAVTRMPGLTLGGSTPIYGDFELTAIPGTGLDRSAPGSIYTIAPAAWAGTPAESGRPMLPLESSSWATTPPETIIPRDGWSIAFEIAADPATAADTGIYDMYLRDVSVTARCLPVNWPDSRLDDLMLQGPGAGIGTSPRAAADLTITQPHPGLSITIRNASLDTLSAAFEDNQHRFPEAVFIGARAIAPGGGTLFTIAQTAQPPAGE